MKIGTVGAPWCDTLLSINEVFTKCALRSICWPAQLQVRRRAINEVDVLTRLVEPDIRTSTLRPVEERVAGPKQERQICPGNLSGHWLSEPKFKLENRFRAWRSRIRSNCQLPPVLGEQYD